MSWINVSLDTETRAQLDRIENMLRVLVHGNRTIVHLQRQTMAIEDDVLNAVLDEGTVIDGAVTLINQLITLVENNKGDPAKLTQALDAIKAKRDALAQAVAAGTAAANEGTSPTGPNQGIPAPGDGSSLGDGGTGGDTTTGTATPPPNVTTTSDVGGNP